jgi:succinate dehydrogenase hydrophobic anchor subunit
VAPAVKKKNGSKERGLILIAILIQQSAEVREIMAKSFVKVCLFAILIILILHINMGL